MFENYKEQINNWYKALDETPEKIYEELDKEVKEIKSEPIYSGSSIEEIEELAIRAVYSNIKYDLNHPNQHQLKKIVELIKETMNQTIKEPLEKIANNLAELNKELDSIRFKRGEKNGIHHTPR